MHLQDDDDDDDDDDEDDDNTSKCWEPITHCHIQQDSDLQGLPVP
jgi:hypothetical protein